jgi:hypothetical protein
MHNLPAEIWNKVFTRVPFLKRIEYKRVCRSWYNILDNYSLFSTIEIFYDQHVVNRFLEMMEQSPHCALAVEELRLMTCLDIRINKRTLLNIFPNVRILRVEWDDVPPEDDNDIYYQDAIEIGHAESKIKHLSDSIHCELASQMLTSNLCDQLECLELNFASTDNISTLVLLDQLKNLPNLKKLFFREITIGIDDLEAIH